MILTISAIQNIVEPIVKNFPVRQVILFGSYARQEANEYSDVDLIVDSGGALDGISFFTIVGDIAKQLPVKSDVFEMQEIEKFSNFYLAVEREGVIIYDRERT